MRSILFLYRWLQLSPVMGTKQNHKILVLRTPILEIQKTQNTAVPMWKTPTQV